MSYQKAIEFFEQYGSPGLGKSRPTQKDLQRAVNLAVVSYGQKISEASSHASIILTHWNLIEPEIDAHGLPKRQVFSRTPCVEEPAEQPVKEVSTSLILDGELEFDWRRGVLYFHGEKSGISHLRICGLPKSDTEPKADFQIDITHMQGMTYSGK